MRRSGFKLLGVVSAVLLGAALLAAGCTELNPDFDPDAGPVCSVGNRQCDVTGEITQICKADSSWSDERECWAETGCTDGLCLPDNAALTCVQWADCQTAGTVCTVTVDPAASQQLGTFCLPAPVSGGSAGGQACSHHDQCASGWCFRQVCFEACSEAGQCTNTQHECDTLDVTVDGVRDSVHVKACVPPAN